MATKSNDWIVSVGLGGEPTEKITLRVYAFDATGSPVTSARVAAKGEARLSIPSELAGRALKVLVGPEVDDPKTVRPAELRRLRAYERNLRVDFEAFPTLEIPEWDWRPWWPCTCQVRGRVVTRLDLPDGTHLDLPICNARVTICEVDRVPRLIWRLPDPLVWKVRDEWLDLVKPPFPIPDPEPEPWPPLPPPPGGLPDPAGPRPGPVGPTSRTVKAPQTMSSSLRSSVMTTRSTDLLRVESAGTTLQLREALVGVADLLLPYLCWWDWLWPLFWYRKDCLQTVEVDETGHFSTLLFHDCSDQPDLYFSVEQLINGTWETVYAPSIGCGTHWNYPCGSEVTIHVTDPRAVPCVPPPDVDPPPGVSVWVMPYAVGNTRIWGSPPPPAPGDPIPAAPAGWVRTDGFTDYAEGNEAPFGQRIGLRLLSSGVVPYSGLAYFRWSYRKIGSATWTPLLEPVIRHFVREVPGIPNPSFPVYPLGPKPGDVFEFRPHTAPLPDPTDPPGTQHHWPVDEGLGDIYSGFMTTHSIEPDAGEYQLRLEVFDAAKNPVAPAPGTFTFVVPSGVDSDGTILTRVAEPTELDGSGFVFRLQIDNNVCGATISAPYVDATVPVDPCGFVRYKPTDNAHVAFRAHHPHGHGRFTFSMVRGGSPVGGASVGLTDVDVAAAAAYTGNTLGDFWADFPVGDLLGTCDNAAFAEHLYVRAKATTGWGQRISIYDAAALHAFALAKKKGGGS
ncbi:MAG: hypothetical protein OEM84_05830 [Acidimicrobiia bacterium]|nr:hypothetical protein [Acidimicrobiia bacterium]